MSIVSTIREIVNLLDQSWVEKIDPRELYQAHAYQLDLTFTQADIPADITGATFSLVIQNANGGSVKTFAGTITDAEKGKGSVSLPAAQMDFSGSDYRALIVFNNSVCARFDLVVKPFGTPAPAPGTVIDWSAYSGYAETATHGPYRAGDNITFTPNQDGSENINAPTPPAAPVQSVDGREGDVTLDDLYLGLTAQAADVDPTGTAIAQVLAGFAKLTGGNTFDASPQIMGILQALASTGLLVRDSEDNLILTIGNQTPGARQLRVEGVIETSGGTVIGSSVNSGGSIISANRGQIRTVPGTGAILESLVGGENLLLRGRTTASPTGSIIFGGLGEPLEFPDLTASRPLSLDANKRAVTLPATDFRTLIGLVIGTDIQEQDTTLQSLADAEDDAARRAAVGGAAKKIGTREITDATGTLALADNENIVKCNRATAQTITIPPVSSVAFPLDAVINLVKKGEGDITIEGGTGVTVNGVSEGDVTITEQYQGATLLHDTENNWIISGAVE